MNLLILEIGVCASLFSRKQQQIYRSIDPEAFLICPTSKWSKENTTPEANDLIDSTLVDAYAYHAS